METNLNYAPLDRPGADSGRYPVRRAARRIWLASLIYLAILFAIALLLWIWGHSRIWQGWEPNYHFWKWAEQNAVSLGLAAFTLGETLIFAWQFHRMGSYLQEVINAMECIQSGDGSWIVLSEDLSETASRMNRIKTQILQSRLQAKEAEQRKNDLVVYLAHDLKTPLTSVLGYLSILGESPDLPAEQRASYLSIARRKAERLEELINEFFEITRFNLTNIELEKRQINFSLLLKQTIFEFGPMLAGKNLECRMEGEADVSLYCDLDKIQRVVDNLLRNACYYAYENTEILLSVRRDADDNVLFVCTNRGPTIPAEKLERIFEQFYRLDTARTSSSGGAGLGLAIARQIAQLHGGSIRAESAEEITSFTLTLPSHS